jgi:hypothetical protein
MQISSDIQAILRLLPQKSERLQCWYYGWKGFMKYAVEMGSGAIICIPSFIRIGLGVRKLLMGGNTHTHTHRQQGNPISLLLFFKNKESRLK